jgi:hypothetical protein
MIGDSPDSDSELVYIKTLETDINSVSRDHVIKITPLVNTVNLEMKLDSGAGVSVISEKIIKEKFFNVKLKPYDLVLKSYSGQKMKPVGSDSWKQYTI